MAGSRNQTDVDFVRFVMCDLNGVARCKVVPRCSYEQLSKPGNIGLPNIVCVLSAASIPTYYSIVDDNGFPDCHLVPDMKPVSFFLEFEKKN